jgi:hypothetical protein
MDVEARLVAAGLIKLGIDDIIDTPDNSNLPDTQSWSREEKKNYLRKLATTIVDSYVLDKEKHDNFVKACSQLEIKANEQRTYRDAGTTGAAGASAPLAFCIFNFVGAVRVQTMGVTGAQKFYNRQN